MLKIADKWLNMDQVAYCYDVAAGRYPATLYVVFGAREGDGLTLQVPLDGADREQLLAWLAAAAGPAMGGVVATEIPPLRVTVTGHTPDPESLRRAAPAIQRAIRNVPHG
jgi:hypothetical protein